MEPSSAGMRPRGSAKLSLFKGPSSTWRQGFFCRLGWIEGSHPQSGCKPARGSIVSRSNEDVYPIRINYMTNSPSGVHHTSLSISCKIIWK